MSDTKFTPGPWDIREILAKAIYERNIRGLRNCWDWDSSGLDDEHPGTRDRFYTYADAVIAVLNENPNLSHLIAAAPDMYEALEMVLRVGRIDDSESRMNQVAAALAKARGEKP